MENIKTIDIADFSITFYGGPEGFQHKCRAIVCLYDKTGKTIGFMKFFNEGVEIENDGFGEQNLFYLNFPESSYEKILNSLKSKRSLQLWFDGKHGMLLENKEPSMPRKGINLN